MIKVVSFNVNSIRIRMHQLSAVVTKYRPDIIGLQETKVTDADFPVDAIESLGYHVHCHGQKTHYGVALLSRTPALSVTKGFPNDVDNAQKRFIAATFASPFGGELRVINGYFPQGENRAHPTKFPHKKRFYRDLSTYLDNHCKPDEQLIVMGDMNIAPTDDDIGIGEDNKKRWLKSGKCSFLPEEREWLQALQNWGLEDTFRGRHGAVNDRFSWFDYRSRGFERDPKRGLRIDLILATPSLDRRCREADIDYAIRSMEKPSDHCPIWATFG